MFVNMQVYKHIIDPYVYGSVGQVLYFFNTHDIQFSQNHLQKFLINTSKYNINFFSKTNWIDFHNVGFHKFENNCLSFDKFQKLFFVIFFK
jgi:hypothetical protein